MMIDSSDYKTIKSENEHKLDVLQVKVAKTINAKKQKEDIVPIMVMAKERITQLYTSYSQSVTSSKRGIISSIYPQRFTFEELQHRTAFLSKL